MSIRDRPRGHPTGVNCARCGTHANREMGNLDGFWDNLVGMWAYATVWKKDRLKGFATTELYCDSCWRSFRQWRKRRD